MKNIKLLKNQSGFAALLTVTVVLGALLMVVATIVILSSNGQRIIRNTIISAQAYYTAESGLEDTLYRIIQEKDWQVTNTLQIDNSLASITINDNGSQKTITVSGQQNNLFRKIQAILGTNTDDVSFHYGVQVGDGGLVMSNNSTVTGNIYSNGPIVGANNAAVTGDVWVAGLNSVKSLNVGGDTHANHIDSCDIDGDAYYRTIDKSSVSGYSFPGSPNPETEELPIPESQVQEWREDGEAGGVLSGDYILSGISNSLGPKKIQGNLIVTNGAHLTVTGTIYVTGSIEISNNAYVIQDEGYQDLSAVVLSDGPITVSNNTVFQTNSAGAFLLFLSSASGTAINIANNSNTVIFYAPNGNIDISNNARLKEVTGYQITISNGAQILYDSGLASARFSSGVGASWEISPWQEVP